MLAEIEQLLVLQDRDRKIATLRQELKLVPLERSELESKLAAQSEQLGAVKQKSKEIEVEKKKLEVEAQAKRDSIAKFKTQQFQTRKNEEFQALSNEIKHAETDIQKIEDRELDLMEEAEKLKGSTTAADKDFAESKGRIERQLADLEEKTGSLHTHLAALENERRTLAEKVEEDLLDRYDRLFASKRDAAIVALEHGNCTGCHMKITTQTVVRVRAEKEIVSCEQCGRLLYFAE
ncbi:MAG: uncharacterized protein QOD99_519 [Chthoniobacter sp.]|nr:uncharacterized protein [Chthoniobacter sp.]